MKKMKKIPDQYKYITTTEFNKLTKEYFAERLKQVNLASKTDISDFLKRTGFDKKLRKINNKVTSSKAKNLTNGYSIITVARNLIEDESQNYLVFQPVFKYFQTFTGTNKTFAWKSEGLSEESFKIPITSGKSFSPKLTFIHNRRMGGKFNGDCLIQDIFYF